MVRRFRAAVNSRQLLTALYALFIGVFFIAPLFRLLAVPLIDRGTRGLDSSLHEALVNTVTTAAASALLALALGQTLAWIAERARWRAGLCNITMWALLIVPSYMIATGWQALLSRPYWRTSIAGGFLFSVGGIVVLIAVKAIPFAYLITRLSYASLGRQPTEAARVHAVPLHRVWNIMGRHLLPAMTGAFLIAFASSIAEFGIPATLAAQIQFPLITYSIYQRLSETPFDLRGAALLSWYLVIAALGCASIGLIMARKGAVMTIGGGITEAKGPLAVPRGVAVLGWCLVAGIGFVGILGPAAALAIAAAGEDMEGVPLPIDWGAIGNSVSFATIASTLAIAVALSFVAQRRSRDSFVARAVDVLTLGNLAVPDIVLGSAYIVSFNSSLLPLYGTPMIVIIAYAASRTPMLMRFIAPTFGQVHVRISEVARVHAVPWHRVLTELAMPLLLAPLAAAWLYSFMMLAFELPISELLYPPGFPTIGVTVTTLNQGLRFAEAARFSIVAILSISAIAAFLLVALRYVTQPREIPSHL